jgi:hypothetical protein
MDSSLITSGLAIGGILTLVTLVFAIIALSKKKKKNAFGWGFAFIISFTILSASAFKYLNEGSEEVQKGIDSVQTHENTNMESEARKTERQEWLDSLQLHNIIKYENSIPADFYANKPPVKDAKGITRIPFLYPFEFNYNNASQTADIIIDGEDSVFVFNVSQIAFDENFAIIKVNKSKAVVPTATPAEGDYLLFDLRTRNYEAVNTMEQLIDLADRIGYVGPKKLQNISDACRGWIEYEVHD